MGDFGPVGRVICSSTYITTNDPPGTFLLRKQRIYALLTLALKKTTLS